MIFNQRIHNWEVTLLLAVTIGLAVAWVTEPMLVATNWLVRLGLIAGCLCGASAIFRLEMRRQLRNEVLAVRYIERVCLVDHHDLLAGEADQLPDLEGAHPWQPVLERVRECLVDYGQRLENAEHARTSAEVRLRRLADEQWQIREIFNGLAEPVLVTNQYNELVLANQAARDVFRLGGGDLERQPLDRVVDCKSLVALVADTRRRKSPSQRHGEIELDTAEGKRWFRIACRSLPLAQDDRQDEHGSVAVLTDISSERNIQKRHAEFVAAASHEMKTPLSGIRAYVELLRDGDADDEATRDEFLGVIETQAGRLQRLIENLLNLARIEAGVVDVEKRDHSLNELLEHAYSVVQPSAEARQIELVKDLSPMYLGVLVDHDMITQAAINLLSNAIKYTEPNGKVTLRSRMEDCAAVLEVEDTGVGLSEEDCGKVFEKFYRVKKDRQMASGTGLGLPLAKHIVEDVHGGSLTLTSQLGKGSIFRISLPSIGRAKI